MPIPLAQGQTSGGPPIGRYVTIIAIADLPPNINGTMRQVLPGPWELELTADGRYRSRVDGAPRAEGRFAVAGAELTFSSETGPTACTLPGQETATYRWALDGQRLTLTPVSDTCRGRVLALSTGTWTVEAATTAQATSTPAGTDPLALPRSGTGITADVAMTTPREAILGLLALILIFIAARRLWRAQGQPGCRDR